MQRGEGLLDIFAELADAEVADEDLALDRQLGIPAKLRRRVSQASSPAVRQNVELLVGLLVL